MKGWGVPLLLLAAVLSGCAGGDSTTTNPNLLAPKLQLAARPDGNATVYVHSAFGEHVYDWIELKVDNRTVANRTSAFSLEERVNSTGFFLDVSGAAQGQTYAYRARVDVVADKLRVSALGSDGAWADPKTFTLPFAQILDHERSA